MDFNAFARRVIALFAAGLGSLLLGHFAKAAETCAGPLVYGKDVDGRDVTSLATPTTRYIAASFVAGDCPTSNRYLPLLVRLAHQFAQRGVRLWLIWQATAIANG